MAEPQNAPRDPGHNAVIRKMTEIKQSMDLKNSILSQSKRSMMASQRQSELGLTPNQGEGGSAKPAQKMSIHNASFYAKQDAATKPKNTNDQEEQFRSMDEHRIPLNEL